MQTARRTVTPSHIAKTPRIIEIEKFNYSHAQQRNITTGINEIVTIMFTTTASIATRGPGNFTDRGTPDRD